MKAFLVYVKICFNKAKILTSYFFHNLKKPYFSQKIHKYLTRCFSKGGSLSTMFVHYVLTRS